MADKIEPIQRSKGKIKIRRRTEKTHLNLENQHRIKRKRKTHKGAC